MADRELIYRADGTYSAKMAAAIIYGGNLVNINTSTGYAVVASDAAARLFAGVAGNYKAAPTAAGGDSVELMTQGWHLFTLYGGGAAITDMGTKVYVYDGVTVAKTGDVSNNVFVGRIVGVESATKVWVDITVATSYTDVAAHIADSSAAHASSAISFADSGSKTAATEVDGALDEIYVDLTSALATIPLPMPNFTTTGSVVGSAGSVARFSTAEGRGLTWAAGESHASVTTKIIIPQDADLSAAMTVELLIFKVGSTEGDATTFNVGWYNNVVSALYDAGSNMGSVTSAATGNALSKTVQKLTLAIGAANLPALGSAVEINLAPTAGTLGTDAVVYLGGQIKYTRKLRTS